MKISELFGLNKTQYELDFVDIDPDVDIPLFLDPYYISKCDFDFATNAYDTIRSYFDYLLALLRGNQIKKAEAIFSHLGESNDLCMGLSTGNPRGRGMGPGDTSAVFKELLKSRAISSGIMTDIEDFRIFVKNVDKDKVSDMTANIIKKHLIDYTKQQCELHGIPLTPGVPSGMYWDAKRKMWDNEYVERLIIDDHPIVIVPKRVVSFTDKYTTEEYRRHFVLNFLKNEHLTMGSHLVQERVDGTKYVTKKSVVEYEPPIDKDYLTRFTESHFAVFSDFKERTIAKLHELDGAVLEDLNVEDVCKHLIEKLNSIPAGKKHASDFHNLIIGILELLFYPNLSTPRKETPIHEGRKRIDITFANSAEKGFFFTVPNHNPTLPCNFIFIECKNYVGKVANPELDQLSGRFSGKKGRIGILVCRKLDDKGEFVKRCADTYLDDRGLIIPLDDSDLENALTDYPLMGVNAIESILQDKFELIAFVK